MAGPFDLTGQNIENTYQRVLQTPDGVNIYDGTGSLFTVTATATAGGSNTQIQFNSASLLSGSSNFSFDYTNNNVILTGSILMSGSSSITGVDYIDFDTTASNVGAVGRLKWNDDDGTLDLGLKGGNVTLQIGQEEVVRVVNKTGINLTEAGYQVVRLDGAQGGRVKVALAKGDGDGNSLDTLGLVTENIAINDEGFVTTTGLVRGINTSGVLQGETWVDGDALYLSPTTFGGLTNTPPIAPSHSVRIGYVVQSNPGNGSIYVKVDNGYEIDELHNVRINTSSLSYGDLLMYDTDVWYNTKQLTGSYGLTGSLNITGNSGSIIDVSSSNAALRVTQRGTGDAIIVEDSTNPDSTPFIVAADGKVLIGTTTPTTSVLTLVGNQSVTGNIYVTNAVQSGTANRLFLGASANANSYFNAGGNLGVGTTSPAYRLDVSGSSRITGDLIVTGTIDGGTF